MYSLSDIGLLILFSLLFTIVYFIYEKVSSIGVFSFLKVRQYIYDITNGFILGIFAFVFATILISIDNNIAVPIFFVVPFTLLLVKNSNVSIASLLAPMIYYAIQHNDMYIELLLFIEFVVLSIINILLKDFLTKERLTYSMWGIFALLALSNTFIINNHLSNNYDRTTIESSIFNLVAAAILFLPLRYTIGFFVSANILSETINYVFSRYYRHALMPSATGDMITEKKVQKGILGKFEVKVEPQTSLISAKEARESLLLKAEGLFGKNSILFKSDENQYGFFIPISEEKIDRKSILDPNNKFHLWIQKIVSQLNIIFETSEEKFVTTSVRCGYSIYGIQSNSIQELEENATHAMGRVDWDSKNKVNIFKFNKFKERKNDYNKLTLMDKRLNLNNFKNFFYPIYGFENDDWNYVIVENEEDYVYKESLRELIRINNWDETFDRYYSMEALNTKDENKKIFVKYSPITFKSFDILEFTKKTNLLKLKKDSIFFTVSYKDIKNNKSIDNINKFIDKGFKVALMDIEGIPINEIKRIKTRVLIVSNNKNYEIYDGFTYINPYINTDANLLSSIRKGIKCFAGKEIEFHNSYAKMNKKSKMFIEDLIKESKWA